MVIIYSCIVWGHCADYLLDRVLKLQKRAVRIISNENPSSHTANLFKDLRILRIIELYELQIAIFMFSYFKDILPSNFNESFRLNSYFHFYDTRTSSQLRLPLYKYEFSRTTISFVGTKCWNAIPSNIKNMPTLSSFKRNYKFTFSLDLKTMHLNDFFSTQIYRITCLFVCFNSN